MASVPATDPLSAIVCRLCAPLLRIVAAGVALAGSLPQAAAVGVDFVYVGDAGNAADTTGYGAVASAYAIGVFELTNAQYVEFLNAVDPDGTNPNSIYSPNMGSDARGGISFTSGNSAGSKYASRTNMADKPVGFVSWFDGARFTNWLQNGGSTYGTTSSGSTAINSGAYTLNGATSGTAPAVTAGSTYRIPNENEWYKAAYYKGSGTNAGYWTYATQSNTAPSLVGATTVGTGTAAGASPVTTGNYANYNYGADWNSLDGNLTSVGSNGGPSAYGAFDMSGNTGEWNDYTGVASTSRAIRGASFYAPAANIASTYTSFYVGGATVEQDNVGLRLASVIPTSLTWSTSSGTWSSSSRSWSNGKGGIYAFAASGTATFSATAGGTITISGTIQPAAITVSATSGTYSFVSSAGNLITGTARLSKSGAATLVLSGSNSFTGGTTLTAGTLRVGHDGALGSGTMTLGGGTLASADNLARSLSNPASITADTVVGDATGTGMLTLSGTINLGGSPRTLTTVADLTISGPMSNGSLTKAGIGTLTLSASNSFTGATTLMGGTLSLGHAGALGASGTISFSGGTLQFTSSNTTDYSSRFATAAGQLYAIDTNGQNVTLATALTSSNASLSKSGGGTLNLTGNNTYTGTTTVSTGTLSIGSGGTTGAVAGNIANSAAVRFNRSDALAYSGTISGTGALIKSGAGTLTLSGNNTYTGTTAVAAGKLLVNGALASSTTSISAAAVLGGSGTISGAVVVGNTGTLSPGNSPGILTVGSLSLSGSAFTLMEIVGSGSTAGVAGTAYDQVAITTANALSFGGTLDLNFGGRTSLFAQGTEFQLFSFSGTTTGDFTTIRTIDASGSYAGLTFAPSPFVTGEWTTGIVAGSGNQYLMFSENTGRLVALPEPSAVAMAALGAGLAGWRLVRRKKLASARGPLATRLEHEAAIGV